MQYFIYRLIVPGLFFVLIMFSSCEEDEDFEGQATISFRDEVITFMEGPEDTVRLYYDISPELKEELLTVQAYLIDDSLQRNFSYQKNDAISITNATFQYIEVLTHRKEDTTHVGITLFYDREEQDSDRIGYFPPEQK